MYIIQNITIQLNHYRNLSTPFPKPLPRPKNKLTIGHSYRATLLTSATMLESKLYPGA